MEIKNKFNVGDKVYVISNCKEYCDFRLTDEEYENCPICKGSNTVNVNGYEMNCPWCFHKNKYAYIETPLEILNIKANIYKSRTNLEYMIDYDDYDYGNEYFFEDCLFSTLEEAIAECNKRNAEMLARYKAKGE